jgi:hypothetical protein
MIYLLKSDESELALVGTAAQIAGVRRFVAQQGGRSELRGMACVAMAEGGEPEAEAVLALGRRWWGPPIDQDLPVVCVTPLLLRWAEEHPWDGRDAEALGVKGPGRARADHGPGDRPAPVAQTGLRARVDRRRRQASGRSSGG